jgi:signal transduction histidine kinase
LRIEKWERNNPNNKDWNLHGSYSEDEVADIAGELMRLSLLSAVPVAMLALGLGYFLAQRSLAPVKKLKQQLHAIGAGNLHGRLRLNGADAEIQDIEASINALLGRLEHSFSQLTEYSAQVAHELRTPLTLLRLQVEEAADKIEPGLAESLQEELARLSDYVDRCLLLAMAERGRLPVVTEPVRIDLLLTDLLEVYQLWAREAGRTLSHEIQGPLSLDSDARHLKQILHALLTNAMKHGCGEISIRLSGDATGAISCELRNRMAPAEARQAGAGLGLRVAKALAGTLGCTLELETKDESYTARLRWEAR